MHSDGVIGYLEGKEDGFSYHPYHNRYVMPALMTAQCITFNASGPCETPHAYINRPSPALFLSCTTYSSSLLRRKSPNTRSMSFPASQKSASVRQMSVLKTRPPPGYEKGDDVELMRTGTECET